MKKIFLMLLAACALCAACSEISEDDRYTLRPPAERKRTVLLEEFTGQTCTNCPTAHRIVNGLKQQYGDGFISVSIHAGMFGIADNPNMPWQGLMTPEGDEYASHWGVSFYPSGMVNRTSGVLNMDDWADRVYEDVAKAPILDIRLSAGVETGEDGVRTIVVHTDLEPSQNIDGYLQLWITESGIRSVQIDGGTTLTDYEHNHVYRASVNGLWGEKLSLSAHLYTTYEHRIAVGEKWDAGNLSVVGFVYNDAEGVLQAAECEVQTDTED